MMKLLSRLEVRLLLLSCDLYGGWKLRIAPGECCMQSLGHSVEAMFG